MGLSLSKFQLHNLLACSQPCVIVRWKKPEARHTLIQGDSKTWTHFVSLYGLNSKRRLNTRQTVGCGIPSSLLLLRPDLRGLRSKLSSIHLTFSSDTRGRPELLPSHRQPICSNWWFERQMLFLVGGWMLKRTRNARCTAVAVSVLINSRTQKFSKLPRRRNSITYSAVSIRVRCFQETSVSKTDCFSTIRVLISEKIMMEMDSISENVGAFTPSDATVNLRKFYFKFRWFSSSPGITGRYLKWDHHMFLLHLSI